MAMGEEPTCCPLYHEAVELIGRRWTGAIVEVLLNGGAMRFSEIAAAVPELSDRLLSERMKELEARGVVERSVDPGPPVKVTYALTAMGRGLEPAVQELRAVGAALAGPPRAVLHLVQSATGPAVQRPSARVPRMSDQPRTAQDVQALVEERQIRFIRFWFTDILGQLKSFSIGASELADAFEAGMGFDGSSITGFNAIEESDMVAMPDPTDVRGAAVAPGRAGRRADVLRRAHARAHALRGRPAPRAAPRAQARRGDGLRHVQRRPRARVLPLQGQARHRGPRRGRLLRPDDARRRLRRAPRDGAGARAARHPRRVLPPRGRARPSTRSTCATRRR